MTTELDARVATGLALLWHRVEPERTWLVTECEVVGSMMWKRAYTEALAYGRLTSIQIEIEATDAGWAWVKAHDASHRLLVALVGPDYAEDVPVPAGGPAVAEVWEGAPHDWAWVAEQLARE